MRSVSLAVAGCLFLAVGGARAESPAGEQLYILPPAGWTIGFHEAKDSVEVTELLPPGQTLKQWTQMLTVQMISGQPAKTPQDALKDQVDLVQKACEEIGAGPINLSVENGYETAMRAIACPKSKQWGDGELSLYKALSGKKRVYLVWRSWRGPAFDKDKMPVPDDITKEWLSFMQQVVLCDTTDAKRSCPTPAAKGPVRP